MMASTWSFPCRQAIGVNMIYPAKEKLGKGELVYGVALTFPSVEAVEFFGHLGFDWAFIDAEHNSVDLRLCREIVRACELVKMMPVVRVPSCDRSIIVSYLEAGATGIMAPHTRSASEAKNLVNAVKFGPIGERGASARTRVANYGLTQSPAEYYQQANDNTFVIALVEDPQGIQTLDEILSMEYVDAIGIGSNDLSMSMGLPGQPNHPEVRKLIGEACSRIVASDKTLVSIVRDTDDARKARKLGARMIAVPDINLLKEAGGKFLSDLK